MEIKEFIEQAAKQTNNDYSQSFKLLGLVVYLAEEGNESLLSGEMISPRTYYRWVEIIKQAGFPELVEGAKLGQVIREFVQRRLVDLPSHQVMQEVVEVVESAIDFVEGNPPPAAEIV